MARIAVRRLVAVAAVAGAVIAWAVAGALAVSGKSSSPTVTVTITLDTAPAGGALSQALVDVDITTDRIQYVVVVPLNAPVGPAGGQFGVDVVTGTTSYLVRLTGTRVAVPSS